MDFQPVFMAGHSLQDRDPSHWEHKVQPIIVPADQPQCTICGFIAREQRSLIQADEVWQFPEPPNVVLVDVRPLCRRCHDAKDFSHLLDRIKSGAVPKEREAVVRRHYCDQNGCSEDEFREDLDLALAEKRAVERRYNRNCRPTVDYGRWDRPSERPRITDDEHQLLRRLFSFREEPILINEYTFSNYGSAVRTLQSIPLNQRGPVLAELRDHLDDEGDDEPITERDEGVQFE